MSAPGTELAGRGHLTPTGLGLASRGQLLEIVYLGSDPLPTGDALLRADARLDFSTEDLAGDLVIERGDLAPERTLLTSVVLSLFSDARAREDDPLPAGETNLRGWWGDSYARVEGDRWGSRLWLLSREKTLASVPQRAREYALEALQWLVDDEIAERVEVEAEIQKFREVVPSVLALGVRIVRPPEREIAYRFQFVWRGV